MHLPPRRRNRLRAHALGAVSLPTGFETTLTVVARTLEYPVAMIDVIDAEGAHLVAAVGTDSAASFAAAREFCKEVRRGGGPVVVADAGIDPRFADGPSEFASGVGSFLGVPLCGPTGSAIGTLCLIDRRAHRGAADMEPRLVQFGRVVEDQLASMWRLDEQRRDAAGAAAEIVDALAAGRIRPWYQPILELATGRVVGFEALARWEHPIGTLRDPDSFVPFAEDSDLVLDLDLAVMRQALRDLSRWHDTRPDVRLGLNLSGRHLQHPDRMDAVLAAVDAAGVPPGSIDLEFAGAAQLRHRNGAGALLKVLRDRGFRVWLDDFGTGWASLEYLMQLPVDGIKVHRLMAMALGTPTGDAVIRAVTGLTADLGMSITVEGIETVAQLGAARAMGCRYGQGYWWSRPVDAAEVADGWLTALPMVDVASVTGPGRRVTLARPSDHPVAPPRADVVAARAMGGMDAGLAAAVLHSLPDATAVLDQTGKIIAVNEAWRLFAQDNGGDPSSTGEGVNYLEVCERAAADGVSDARYVADGIRGVLAGSFVDAEWEYPCPSPEVRRWFLGRISPFLGSTRGAVVSHVNITRRKMAEDQLAHAAHHDALTGLANRTLLAARLLEALTDTRRLSGPAEVGVLCIDLDGFKHVNDTLGHSAGDEVLQTVAYRLCQSVRPTDTVARPGGDEFTIVLPRIARDDLTAIVARIKHLVSEPIQIHGQSVVVGASVGLHLAAVDDDVHAALRIADRALYAAKSAHHAQLAKA